MKHEDIHLIKKVTISKAVDVNEPTRAENYHKLSAN